MYNIKIDDIKELGTILVVTIPNTKTKVAKTFTITKHLNIYKKYRSLRPKNYSNENFFINFQKGKCTRQVVGINKIGKVPSDIARYLNLSHADQYTGHCFRRSSASILVETGTDLLTLKQHGGWKSSAVAEGYIETSINKKNDISNRILSIQSASTSTITSNSLLQNPLSASTSTTTNNSLLQNSLSEATSIKFDNLTNCTINVNNYYNKEN